MMRHDVAIVGGGCVGLSVAKHLTERTDLDVAVLEKEHHLASHQSGRNSGVLHPGFNYPPDSKKARFATEGTARMKAYCEEHDVPCEELGVLVVATDDEEEARLDDLAEQAEANGGLLRAARLPQGDPSTRTSRGGAGRPPRSGGRLRRRRAIRLRARERFERRVSRCTRDTRSRRSRRRPRGTDSTRATVGSRSRISSTPRGSTPTPWPTRSASSAASIRWSRSGEYYEVRPERAELCETMIYPTPNPELPFLGVHYTRRTDGKVIVGPNAVLAFGRRGVRQHGREPTRAAGDAHLRAGSSGCSPRR